MITIMGEYRSCIKGKVTSYWKVRVIFRLVSNFINLIITVQFHNDANEISKCPLRRA